MEGLCSSADEDNNIFQIWKDFDDPSMRIITSSNHGKTFGDPSMRIITSADYGKTLMIRR